MGQVSNFFSSVNFNDIINPLVYNGWYQYLFPFLLVYAVVLTILNRVEVLKDNKATRVIVALVFGLFSIAFPISNDGRTLGEFLMILFPGVTAFTMGILALYIVAAMLGVDLISLLGKDDKNKQIMKYILGGIGLIVVAYYYAKGFGWYGLDSNFWLWRLLSDPLLWIIIIFGAIFYWISSEDNSSKKGEEA